MPIHDQSYRHWEGTFKSHTFRWWIIAREGLRIILRRKLFLLLVLGPPTILFLVFAGGIYGINNPNPFLRMFAGLKGIDQSFFFFFLMRQTFFIALICVFGGSGLIADDLKNNALQLYLSKPLTRLDYLIGKFVTILILMGFITLAPGFLLFLENALLSGDTTFLKQSYWVLGSILLYSLILTVPTALLILALSSMTKNSRYAAIIFIAILIGTPIFSEIVKNSLKLEQATFISYWSNLHILGRRIFRMPDKQTWYWSMCIVLGIVGSSIWIMARKIKGVEIVK